MTASYRFNPMRVIARAALGLLLAASVTEAQQNAVLTGKVTSEAGQVLAQAQVYITEMTISVATNDQGVYTITIPAARATGQTVNLRARAIGYAPAVAQVQLNLGSQTRDFTLRRDINRLSEVTVTGSIEGTERAKVPFAIGRVTAEEMPVPSLDPMKALVGKVPGLRVAQAGGAPGSAPQIMLRGPTSLNASGRGTGPLIIVDGTIMRVGNLSEIGALDIESVEVVKGAAGASLYGTTAANGVIIIKTKRGNTRDGTTWTARTEYGRSDLSDVFYDPPVSHILQLDETGTRFCVQGTGTASNCSRSFDWMHEILRINGVNADTVRTAQTVQFNAVGATDGSLLNAFQANWWPVRYDAFAQVATANPFMLNSIDAAGRVGSVRYFVSGQYTTDQGGIKGLVGQQNRRARVNLDYDIRQDWRLSLSTVYNQGSTDNRSGGSSNGGIWGQMLRGAPGGTDYLARDTLGRPIVRGGGAPLRGSGNGGGTFLYDMGMIYNTLQAERYNASVSTTFTPLDWVTLEGGFAFDNRHRTNPNYLKKGYRTFGFSPSANFGQMGISDLDNESMNANISATIRRELTSDLTGKASVRAQYEREDQWNNNGSGQQFVVAEVYTLSNTLTEKTATSSSSSVRSIGMLGGVNLDYKGRYILDMTYRYDGSSLFGAGNRWAPFGRVSAVWIASEEPFWNVPGVSEFRIRASRGTAGNTPSFTAQYETYSCGTAGCSLGQAGNPNLKPETTTETEIGVDFTVMDRLGVEITNASSSTVDQILNVNTPAILGFSSQWQNAGTLSNNTWEIAINLPIISRADLQWDLRASYDRNRTYITNLVPPDYFSNITGQGTGSIFFFTDDDSEVNGFPMNRIGNIWGRSFYRSCSELPDFALSTGGGQTLTCGGPGSDFQVDDKGFVVWTGAGNGLGDGITRNLWQTKLPAADSPWGYPLHFGHPITQRPLAGQPGQGVGSLRIIGNTMPDFRLGFNSTLTWKKLTVYGLFDGTFGHELQNQAEGWGIFDHNAQSMDQNANTPVSRAKPAGYSWRVGGSEGAGTGGLYDILGPNNYNTETASYIKMRELNVSYRIGPIAGTGDWTVSLLGRNMFTITDYSGMDPETGVQGGSLGSGLVNGVDAFNFPTLRSFTFAISTRF